MIIRGTPGAFLEPVGIPNDPNVTQGSFGPTTRLMIAIGGLLDLFWGLIISLSNSAIVIVVFTEKGSKL